MLLYAVTIFISAFLLFQVQPMIAKMILPWFGGTAAVWATCLLFFQTVLLLGYLYSHGLVVRLKPKHQRLVHWTLLAACLLFLPVIPSAAWKPLNPDAPTLRILGLLAATIGLPYFTLSTTGPLVQAWFVQARPGAIPYRLFALSNLASMLALLSYPPLIEPYLALGHQAIVWSAGFAVFAVLCALAGWRSYGRARETGTAEVENAPEAPARPGDSHYLLWVALAACPSMLLLSLTGHLSQDVAPIPFLWVLPLALYLLTFILCFDAEGWYRRLWMLCLYGPALGFLGWLMTQSPSERPNVRIVIPLAGMAFFLVCMVCHGELARLKPHPRYLTGYFLMVSIGGAIGGVFVALVAPRYFKAAYEFPVAIGLSAAVAVVALLVDAELPFRKSLLGWPSILLMSAAAVLLGYLGQEMREMVKGHLVVARNFYGQLKVTQYNGVYEWDGYRTLVHGAINHGEQYSHPARRKTISTYYCEDSGLGLAMRSFPAGAMKRVGICGLGAGTLAAYSHFGDVYRFYEINPLVRTIANSHFWYLQNAEGLVEVAMGDARLTMEREAPQKYDVLVMDAFSSDSVPVHLLTREAIALYFRHLKPDGMLAVHISNRFIDLEPVLSRGAQALGKKALVVETDDDDDANCFGTTWVLMTSGDNGLFDREEFRKAGKPLAPAPNMPVWTDDYSNLYRVLK